VIVSNLTKKTSYGSNHHRAIALFLLLRQNGRWGSFFFKFSLVICLNFSLGSSFSTSSMVQASEPAANIKTYQPKDIWRAAKAGDADLIAKMIASGTNIDTRTSYGATALSFAAERGRFEVAKLLVEAGADVNNADTFYGFTPYIWAKSGGHQELVEFLESHGATAEVDDQKPKSSESKESPDSTSAASAPEHEKRPENNQTTFNFPELSPEQIEKEDQEACSSNWPQFRGVGGRGISEGRPVPLQWDATESKNVLWQTPIPGLGHSCPSIWEDQVYVTTAVSSAGNDDLKIGHYGDVASVDDESVHRFVLYCLNRQSGAIEWERTCLERKPRYKRHLKSTHANATVATNGQYVVVSFGAEGLFCFTTSGELVWQHDLGTLNSGWFYDDEYEWGFGSSPIIWNDRVIIQCDAHEHSYLAALSLADGSELWKVDRDEVPSWSTPTVHETPVGPMIITNATRGIRGYDGLTGELWWTLSGGSEIVVPTPFVAYETIFAVSGYRPIKPIYAIALRARGDITPAEGQTTNEHLRWSIRKGGSYLPTPLAYRGRLYVCSNLGIISCYDAQSGKRIYKERLQIQGVRSFVGSPVAADGHIFLPAEDGQVYVLPATEQFEPLHHNQLGENILTTPAIVDGVIFIRAQRHIFALADKGEI